MAEYAARLQRAYDNKSGYVKNFSSGYEISSTSNSYGTNTMYGNASYSTLANSTYSSSGSTPTYTAPTPIYTSVNSFWNGVIK
jgi:hypothetical protein